MTKVFGAYEAKFEKNNNFLKVSYNKLNFKPGIY